MGLLGILLGLGALVWLSFRGWSVLVLAPAAGLIAALAAGEPLLAHWTQTFMGSAAGFLAQVFPLFLLGALFGKLMDDSGSVTAIARFMTERLGPRRAVLAVVLAGAAVTYGGVSLFVAFFVPGPIAQALFRAADIPNRLMPAAIALGTSTFTMSALPGTPAIQNAIPMPFFGTLLHRVAVIGSGTLDSLPHNGAVVTLLAVCGSTHRESYFDIMIGWDCGRGAGARSGDRPGLDIRFRSRGLADGTGQDPSRSAQSLLCRRTVAPGSRCMSQCPVVSGWSAFIRLTEVLKDSL